MASLKLEILQEKPFANLEQETFLNLMRTADALTRDIEELFKPSGLSPTQYNVLRILRGSGDEGLACGQIIERMITRDPDLTRLLDRMEKRELISRSRSTTDRRVVLAKITRTGLDVLASLDQPVVAMHRRQLGHLSEAQLKQLIALLELVREQKKIDA